MVAVCGDFGLRSAGCKRCRVRLRRGLESGVCDVGNRQREADLGDVRKSAFAARQRLRDEMRRLSNMSVPAQIKIRMRTGVNLTGMLNNYSKNIAYLKQ